MTTYYVLRSRKFLQKFSTVAKICKGPKFFGCSPSPGPLQFCVAKFGNLGANGVKGSKFLVENVILRIADPDLPIHYATFMRLQ